MSDVTKRRHLLRTALIASAIHLLIGTAAQAVVVADFTWSPTSPMPGQQVQFTDTSTGNPTSWLWDFDNDGVTDSTLQNPTWTFAPADTYPVKLTALVPPADVDEIIKNVVVGPEPAGELSFTSSSYSVDENVGTALIPVRRTGGSTGTVSARCDTLGGTATAGVDYIATMDTLVWADGDTSDKTCTVPIIDDAVVEGNETVGLTLTNFTGGATAGVPSTATLAILDDDVFVDGFDGTGSASIWDSLTGNNPYVTFASAISEVDEGVGTASVTVRRIGDSAGAVSVSCETADGTATAGMDYTAQSDLLEWSDGEVGLRQCTIPIIDDLESEADETIILTLTNLTGPAALGLSTAVLTIFDNEPGERIGALRILRDSARSCGPVQLAPVVETGSIRLRVPAGDRVRVALTTGGEGVLDQAIPVATGEVIEVPGLRLASYELEVTAGDGNASRSSIALTAGSPCVALEIDP